MWDETPQFQPRIECFWFWQSNLYILGCRKRQREAGAAGQAADQAQRKRQQSPDLLSNGPDVGHSGWVPYQETLPIPGNICTFVSISHLTCKMFFLHYMIYIIFGKYGLSIYGNSPRISDHQSDCCILVLKMQAFLNRHLQVRLKYPCENNEP